MAGISWLILAVYKIHIHTKFNSKIMPIKKSKIVKISRIRRVKTLVRGRISKEKSVAAITKCSTSFASSY